MVKARKIISLVVLVCSLWMAGCNSRPSGEGLSLTAHNYPRVDGSTSAHPLGVFIACELLNVSCSWSIHLDGTRRLLPDASGSGEDAAAYIGEHIVHHGTHDAYVHLIQGEADLILVARLPSQDELELAERLGVELEAKAIALDAFVFILNRNNPVEGLTMKEIQDIYTGKITNWSEVGGRKAEIHPYQRNDNSGSQELMKTLVMNDLPMIEAPSMMMLYGMMGPINVLSDDEDGIGYSVYFFEQFMAPNEGLKLCGVDGVVPSYQTIGTREYPLTTEVYAVIRGDLDEDSSAYQLRDWLLSKEGQEVIKESGYVPIY